MVELRVKIKDKNGVEFHAKAYISKWIVSQTSAPLKRLNYIEYIVIGDERILPNESYLFLSILTGEIYKIENIISMNH